MSAGDDDRDLREALRLAHASTRAPSFEALWTRATRSPTPRLPRWLVATASACALGLCGSLLLWTGSQTCQGREPLVATYSFSSWQAPTDCLLQAPGSDLLTTVPTIGVPVELELSPQDLQED